MAYIPVKRLQKKFIDLCWKWIAEHKSDKAGLAKSVGVKEPRIYELLNEKRILSMYYIKIFILGGVFKVADIFDNAPESTGEQDEWDYLKMVEDTEVQKALARAMRGTLDRANLLALLKTHYPKNDSSIIKAHNEE